MFTNSMKLNTSDTTPYQSQHMEHWQVIASSVAHDFSNLLTSILGQSTLALHQLPQDASARRHIEKVIKAVEYATTLTDQLLTYSKGNQDQIRPVNLNLLVRDNLNLLDATFLDGISVNLELDPDLPPIQAKHGQLQQIVMNLLINAAEAIHPQKGTITIRTGTNLSLEQTSFYQTDNGRFPSNNFIYLQVQDNGSGMSPTTLNRIFEPYFTTKPTGRGLGLATIHETVNDHQGSISVNSQVGTGTTFTIYFPCGHGHHAMPFPIQ